MLLGLDMGETRPRREKGGAGERRCVVSRASAPRTGLIRFALAPDNGVVPDLAENLPGRGCWVTADRATVETARAKGHFARAFEAPARAQSDLADLIERRLAERCTALIGLARRANAIMVGRDQVRAAISAGQIAVLLTASESDGRDAAELAQRFASRIRAGRKAAAPATGAEVDPVSVASVIAAAAPGNSAADDAAVLASAATGAHPGAPAAAIDPAETIPADADPPDAGPSDAGPPDAGPADGGQRVEIPYFTLLTAAEIGAALGRTGIVHLGVKPGRLADLLAREIRRLSGFRAGPAGRGIDSRKAHAHG